MAKIYQGTGEPHERLAGSTMRTMMITSRDGLRYQVESDGKTVWVHSQDGYTVGRFSAKGIDVHAPPWSRRREHCLDCRPGRAPFGLPHREEWNEFVASMADHYEVDLPPADTVQLIDSWAD